MIITPIKIQGKKTKLVPHIIENIDLTDNTIWVEPFLGSGEVLFNVNPNKAIVSDNNKLIIDFYKKIQTKKISSQIVREFLEEHGKKLEDIGEQYYYEMRDIFNKTHDPLYFLFLNRSCFNGMIRFNSKKEFNVPFCKKENRFAKAYITKIVNQVKKIEDIILSHGDNWQFICCNWKETFNKYKNNKNAFFYFDPPYINRNSDYFNKWEEKENNDFFNTIKNNQINFIFSNWYSNKYRNNDVIINNFENNQFTIVKIDHFYHVGGKETNRNSIIECLIKNKDE